MGTNINRSIWTLIFVHIRYDFYSHYIVSLVNNYVALATSVRWSHTLQGDLGVRRIKIDGFELFFRTNFLFLTFLRLIIELIIISHYFMTSCH